MNIFFKILCFAFFLFKTTALFSEDTKIKIGALVPLSGENSALGKQIISSIRANGKTPIVATLPVLNVSPYNMFNRDYR